MNRKQENDRAVQESIDSLSIRPRTQQEVANLREAVRASFVGTQRYFDHLDSLPRFLTTGGVSRWEAFSGKKSPATAEKSKSSVGKRGV